MKNFQLAWKFWAPASVFSFFLASILLTGWPEGLIPNITYPYLRGGDAAFTDWGVQRLIEGWLFNNPRSGYPFGSNFLDYPSSDFAGFLILKILGMVSGEYFVATNLFLLLSFPFITISSYATLRALRVNTWLSLAASLVYTFAPFHFLKAGHIFYTWYFVVPIFFYIAFKCFENKKKIAYHKRYLSRHTALIVLGLLITSSFGVYYALFGVIVIAIGGIAGAIANKSYQNLILSIAAISIVIFGVIANISPSLINNAIEGKNPEAVSRSLYGSEIYGFKIVQLILPRPGHRVEFFAKKTDAYNSSTPLVTENVQSSLGAIGSLGLLILAGVLVKTFSGRVVDSRLRLLALITIVLILFGTIGGLGSLFSMLVTTSIRGWTRISIFISFGAITAFFIGLQLLIERKFSCSQQKYIYPVLCFFLICIGILDQTTSACKPCNISSHASFNADRKFIVELENKLPVGTAVYQLPYMYFPENPGLFRLPDYEHAVGLANSKELRWSYGGMKGRKGDQFFRALSKAPIEKQLEVIKNLGFGAIYIDRRGFSDNANSLLLEIRKHAGDPIATRHDGEVVVFEIMPTNLPVHGDVSYDQMIEKANFTINGIQETYLATINDGIDFKREGYPSFLKSVFGIDAHENWGRWSNANLNPSVKIVFKDALPKKFTLDLKALGYGQNINGKTRVQVGESVKFVLLQADANQEHKLQFENPSGADTIEITPPKPTSPNELNYLISDTRKIGIGLVSIKIIPS